MWRVRAYIEQGRRWVVDIDLEKIFDRVNHDVLMARVVRKVKECGRPPMEPDVRWCERKIKGVYTCID